VKVLVTGADGFIGSHLTEALVRAGHEVRAFVYYNSLGSWGWLDESPKDVLDQLSVIAGDVRDTQRVSEAMAGCECVLHLAALVGIPFSYQAPESYVDTNVKGTLNVLHAARLHGVRKVLHTSTSEVYGSAQTVPISERHPLHGQSPYAATKIAADAMAIAFHRSFKTPVCVVRPFNTYGPRQSARAVIPTIISQIASGSRRIKLGALRPTRDFNFVSDTVSGFVAALNSEKGIGEVVNFGSGFEISISDLAALIGEVLGVTVEIETEQARVRPADSEVERLCCDSTLARSLFGWRPEFAGRDGLRRGIAATAGWLREAHHLGRYRPTLYGV
jgi:NAD dependent epimerase/dehydratase